MESAQTRLMKVLVVDDEEGFRDYIGRSVALEGHTVKTAGGGREAIDLGLRFRPDVLVADWMLKETIHGLHVVEVLKAVIPQMHAILMTGFATGDLKHQAERARVHQFLEKPFSLDDALAAVRSAGQASPRAISELRPAVVEADDQGKIVFANEAARTLFSAAGIDSDPADVEELFEPGQLDRLRDAETKWVMISARGAGDTSWHIRVRSWSEDKSKLLAFLPPDELHFRRHPIFSMLLGYQLAGPRRWPLEGNVLIVDGEQLVRQVVVAGLEQAQCICHAAENPQTAQRLFERDPQIRVVILDHDLPATELTEFVAWMKAERPEVTLVGTSGSYRRNEFAMLGVERFVLKPWRVDDLMNVLTGHIGNCIDCGLPLPLRRPQPEDKAQSWICAECGARYHAVRDDDFPAEIQRNVRPASQS